MKYISPFSNGLNSALIYKTKSNSSINEFKDIQNFLRWLLSNQAISSIRENPELFIEGFEWSNQFETIEATCYKNLTINESELTKVSSKLPSSQDIRTSPTKLLFKEIIRRIQMKLTAFLKLK